MVLFAAVAPFARAEEIDCTGTLGAITVDDVRVPDSQTCTLNGTEVEGSVRVDANATLFANGAQIDVNVQAENAAG